MQCGCDSVTAAHGVLLGGVAKFPHPGNQDKPGAPGGDQVEGPPTDWSQWGHKDAVIGCTSVTQQGPGSGQPLMSQQAPGVEQGEREVQPMGPQGETQQLGAQKTGGRTLKRKNWLFKLGQLKSHALSLSTYKYWPSRGELETYMVEPPVIDGDFQQWGRPQPGEEHQGPSMMR